MGAPQELIQELDSSIAHSTDQRKSVMLRHLTDIFLVGSDQYSDDEIDLIDDVFVRLVATIEQSSRALLAIRLGPIAIARVCLPATRLSKWPPQSWLRPND
jgi:hypothetical protein